MNVVILILGKIRYTIYYKNCDSLLKYNGWLFIEYTHIVIITVLLLDKILNKYNLKVILLAKKTLILRWCTILLEVFSRKHLSS